MTNSSAKLSKYFNNYDGFEMDVHYNDKLGNLQVSHDYETAEESLSDMFSKVDGLNKKYLWLDVKNLKSSNKNKMLSYLKKLTAKYDMPPARIILESPAAAELGIFTKAGFLTSYFWPKEIKQELYAKAVQDVDNNDVIYISGHHSLLKYLNYYCPKMHNLSWYLTKNSLKKSIINNHIFEHYPNTEVMLNESND